MTDTKTEWYFIVNPRAGSGKTMSQWVPAEQKLDRYGVPYVTAMTDHKRHASALAYEAAEQGYRRIVAVGGDGSLHEALTGIVQFCDKSGTPTEDFYLGVVPIGSGNDWIKSLGVPHDIDEVIKLIAACSSSPMDVVEVKSDEGKMSLMANVGGTGFDSHVCKRVNIQKERGRRGKMIYLNALRYTIFHLKPINVSVMADADMVYSGPCYSIALGNGRYSGSGMRQVPKADINDGMLDYMIVPKIPLRLITRELPRLFNGTIDESHVVLSGRCKTFSIQPLDEASADIIEMDGEIEGRLPLYIEMTDRKINAIKG